MRTPTYMFAGSPELSGDNADPDRTKHADHVSPNDFVEPFSLATPKWNLGSRNRLVNKFPLARDLGRHGCRDMRVIEVNQTENIPQLAQRIARRI
jgi:hypothetical protein